MKVIKYQMRQTVEDDGVDRLMPEEYLSCVVVPYSVENEERARAEAYGGEYIIEKNSLSDLSETPTQLDRIEAQVTYTAMMTDTLLEV